MVTIKRYFIKTFGCQQNVADSERIASYLQGQGMKPTKNIKSADYIAINSCMVRQTAENRVYGMVNNLAALKAKRQAAGKTLKIVVTGCMVGLVSRDKTGKYLKRLQSIMPAVDEFLPIEEIGFEHPQIRADKKHGYVIISNGCNNFCTFCVVPFTRGREISRPYQDIINECLELKSKGYSKITLLGMNVNSYGADLVMGEKNIQVLRDLPDKVYFSKNQGKSQVTSYKLLVTKSIKPIYVKHLGRYRIPTLFPYLLEDVAKIGFEEVNFVSSNPWDFSDELIDVIARNKNISRTLHIAVQSGDDSVLKKMNRWYSAAKFIERPAN